MPIGSTPGKTLPVLAFSGLTAASLADCCCCLQFRKIIKWYSYAIRPPKELYHRLINLGSAALFDDTVASIRSSGPISALPGHFEPRVPVPGGPIDKW